MSSTLEPVNLRHSSTGRAMTGVVLVVIGVLWLLETAGARDIDWFYVLPGILGLIGLMMVAGVGGRSANALMPLGFLLIAFMFLGTLAPPRLHLDPSVGNRSFAPSTAADMKSEYRHGMGNLDLDLRRLTLEESRTVRASVGMGELVVRVPERLAVDIRTSGGLGEVNVFGEEEGGVSPDVRYRSVGAEDAEDVLTLELSVGMGSVEVRR